LVSIEDEKKLLTLLADIKDLKADVETLQSIEATTIIDELENILRVIRGALKEIAWVKYKEETKLE